MKPQTLMALSIILLGAGIVCTTIRLPHYAFAYGTLAIAAAVLARK